jgi:ADP-ribosylglycohydrolase/fructose-1,6-bisphosphatase/inositol monophosphatase family enzyme
MSAYGQALTVAVDAAARAAALIREEFHRPGGPRGSAGHAPVDDVCEALIRAALREAFPRYGYLGEESGAVPAAAGEEHCWVVDPNDGTSVFLRGGRGSAVSIALLRAGMPVLGVVHAATAPDDDGDAFAWAEGEGPVRRNGVSVQRPPWAADLGPGVVVLVSDAADANSPANAAAVAPARFRATTSLAYRLALAAVGEGEAAVSLGGPHAWDYAAGHALVRATGGELYDADGTAVTYSVDGHGSARGSFCIGGGEKLAAALATRAWADVLVRPVEEAAPPFDLVRPTPGRAVRDAGRLRRAQGALLGQLAGDALGAQVEFQGARAIASRYPNGVREIADGGTWETLGGQPTDDSELALMLARTLGRGGWNEEAVARAYRYWYESRPFDVGNTTRRALGARVEAGEAVAPRLRAAADGESQSNGALMRVSPLGIWGHARTTEEVARLAALDAALTHPHPVCQAASAAFAAAVRRAVADGTDARGTYQEALATAERIGAPAAVRDALERAATAAPRQEPGHEGWVLVALQNAFYQLLRAPSLEEGLVATVGMGGDTDTNGAIAGALLGAVHGREAIPPRWRNAVLSCRPLPGTATRRPRPRAFWPVDAMVLAEQLLVVGG